MPSGILIHPNVCPQHTNVTDGELCVLFVTVSASLTSTSSDDSGQRRTQTDKTSQENEKWVNHSKNLIEYGSPAKLLFADFGKKYTLPL